MKVNIIESNLNFKSLSYGNNPIMLVLHHAEAKQCSIQDIHNWHLQNGWSGCGYHFLVRKDGSIYRGRPENAIGAHCPNANDKSLGICAEGSFNIENMSATQKQAIIQLGQYLKNKYGIKQVYGHKELYSTECPCANYPLNEVKQAILSGSSSITNNVINNTVQDNNNVLELQRLCNSLGVRDMNGNSLVEDGITGQCTRYAVSHLPLCGIPYTQREATKYIQKHLNINVDGVFYTGTEQAVKQFQARYGLVPDGIVGSKTWNKFLEVC